MDQTEIKLVIEAALLASGKPLSFEKLVELFTRKGDGPDRAEIRAGLEALSADYEERGLEVKEVGSGFRIQVRSSMADWLQPLWEERAPRYTRALLETLALIAYRQPITRGEIEEVRGVAVSSNIVRTLMERSWVRVVGHRDVPGKPAMLGTTREFLDYFGLKKLEDLPALADFDEEHPQSSPQGDFIESLDGGESAESEAGTEGTAVAEGDPAESAAGPHTEHATSGVSDSDESGGSDADGATDEDVIVAFAEVEGHTEAAAPSETPADALPTEAPAGTDTASTAAEPAAGREGPASDEPAPTDDASMFFRALADSLDQGRAPNTDAEGKTEPAAARADEEAASAAASPDEEAASALASPDEEAATSANAADDGSRAGRDDEADDEAGSTSEHEPPRSAEQSGSGRL